MVHYEQYLKHYQAAQRALSAKQPADARRELLLASRELLAWAAESGEAEQREARKQKGLKLLEMARRIPDDAPAPPRTAGSGGGSNRASGDEPADETPAAGRRWQVLDKPGIRFDDIAGLQAVKDLIRRRVILPFRNPQLASEYGRKPGGGVLMYGPPGTGKTMMAKAIATELDAPFYNVQCSEVMSKWVGEAEQNLRDLFATARQRLPAVVFFDETESLVARRGGQSTVMNRLIPEFLAQVDGVKEGPAGLLLLGATNRPWDMDPAALRPGRFGEQIYIGLPDQPARRFILGNSLGRVPCEAGICLDDLAARAEGFSGADLQGLVDRIVDPVFEEAMNVGRPVPVRPCDVQRGLDQSRPSVSARELARYEKF
jgi:transitional endoplasmic reticulum ATPase